ncbi:RNA-binding protein with serine-rich domain 1-B [Trichonephila clavipes]|nr:RNA-binding protein with serine-rich domain 1-B [Trichonephila clavipes]
MCVPLKKNVKSPSVKRRRKSPSPRLTKIQVSRLTRNVTKEHVQEIFSTYGPLRNVDLVIDRDRPHLSRGFAYVEFENPEDAEKALNYMDGGQIDGQEVSASLVQFHPAPQRLRMPRPSPMGMRRAPPPWRRSPPGRMRGSMRARRRSPPRYRRRTRSRSRSINRRRQRSSSSSSR